MADIVPYKKGALGRWFDRAMSTQAVRRVKDTSTAVAYTAGHMAGGAAVGAALGALHVNLKTGLDVKVKDVVVPIDGMIAAAAGPVLGLYNASGNAAAIYSFRMTYGFLAEKRLAKGEQPGGAFGATQKSKIQGESDYGEEYGADPSQEEDPIIAAARGL